MSQVKTSEIRSHTIRESVGGNDASLILASSFIDTFNKVLISTRTDLLLLLLVLLLEVKEQFVRRINHFGV